jgi:hypothetical protein
MHTFRFNPVFRQWVLLGTPVSHEVTLTSAHLLHSGAKDDFLAATNPKQPFVMDPPTLHGNAHALVQEQPPVGEYEFLLSKGSKTLREWGVKEWEQWLALLQKRLLHLHHNPHLTHVQVALHTAWVGSVGESYKRVGDVIATSHPVAGAVPLLEKELVNKLRHTERGYIIHDGDDGIMYAPSAPQCTKEVWYIPANQSGGFDASSTSARLHTAEALTLLMRGMLTEWRHEHFILELHTSLVDKRSDATWWIRIYQEQRRMPATLTVLPLPEQFVRDLSYLVGPGKA